MSQKPNVSQFQHRVRVRVCGILIENGEILLLKHEQIGTAGFLWAPPGGGVEFGEDLQSTLVREFKEETGLDVQVEQHLFTNEFISDKLHALEFFFSVQPISGQLRLGSDPEMDIDAQIITEVRFFSEAELKDLDSATIHNAFRTANAIGEIEKISGLITFKD